MSMDDAVQSQPYDEPAKVEPPKLDLEAIRARAEAATPGPWEHRTVMVSYGRLRSVVDNETGGRLAMCDSESVAAFIAHAREDVPDLLGEVARLTRELDEARQLVRDGLSSGPHWVAPAAAVARWDAEAAEAKEAPTP